MKPVWNWIILDHLRHFHNSGGTPVKKCLSKAYYIVFAKCLNKATDIAPLLVVRYIPNEMIKQELVFSTELITTSGVIDNDSNLKILWQTNCHGSRDFRIIKILLKTIWSRLGTASSGTPLRCHASTKCSSEWMRWIYRKLGPQEMFDLQTYFCGIFFLLSDKYLYNIV